MTTAAKLTKTQLAQEAANKAFMQAMIDGLGWHQAIRNAMLAMNRFIKPNIKAIPWNASQVYKNNPVDQGGRSAAGQLEDQILHLQKIMPHDFYQARPELLAKLQQELDAARAELAAMQADEEPTAEPEQPADFHQLCELAVAGDMAESQYQQWLTEQGLQDEPEQPAEDAETEQAQAMFAESQTFYRAYVADKEMTNELHIEALTATFDHVANQFDLTLADVSSSVCAAVNCIVADDQRAAWLAKDKPAEVEPEQSAHGWEQERAEKEAWLEERATQPAKHWMQETYNDAAVTYTDVMQKTGDAAEAYSAAFTVTYRWSALASEQRYAIADAAEDVYTEQQAS